jgi:hypothetical protein
MSGVNPDLDLVEMIELPGHPWFVGTQFPRIFQYRGLSTSFVCVLCSSRSPKPFPTCPLNPALIATP